MNSVVSAMRDAARERQMGRRAFDVCCVVVSLPVVLPVAAMVAAAVKLTSKGPVLHWSKRVGRYNQQFWMPKFRSMRQDCPQLATHLISDPQRFLTPIGGFLRKTSLDELPQLWSVLRGDLALVGPRPALFNQDDLVALRQKHGIEQLLPGITGLAQVKGRDHLSIAAKVECDAEYLRNESFWFDLKILWLTIVAVSKREGVKH